MTTLLAGISGSFTSITASTPINLPTHMSKGLNTDVKHIAASVLPGLDTVFLEARLCAEQRIVRDVYPAFVKSQLVLATSVSLSAEGPYPLEYPGLGDAFCLSHALSHDMPIEYASDGFLAVTGYDRSRIIGQNCRLLQGPMTDRTTVSRIRETVSRGEECVELILNYREDGTPFWNLLYICPLTDARGRVKFYLGAQISVSDAIGSHKDVLRVLNFGTGTPLDIQGLSPTGGHSNVRRPGTAACTPAEERDRERGSGGESSLRSRGSIRSKSSRRPKFFKFRKPTTTAAATATATSTTPYGNAKDCDSNGESSPPLPPPSHHSPDSAIGSTASLGLESLLNNNSFLQRLSLPNQMENFRTAYSRFLVLRHIPGAKVGKLVVEFASRPALEILNLGFAADVILQKDVFTVLAEHASCPSVNRNFKAAIRESVLRDAKATTMELFVAGGSGMGRKASVVAVGGGEERAKSRAGKNMRMVSYWTPVKDRVGDVGWVVLTVAPGL